VAYWRAPARPRKSSWRPFLVFNQQFLTLIRAGLPILGSIELLARRQKLPHFRAQLEDVATRVKNGESISEAFVAQGGFPIVYTTTLLAASAPETWKKSCNATSTSSASRSPSARSSSPA